MFCVRRMQVAADEAGWGRMNGAGCSGHGAGLSNLLLLCGGLESQCFGLLFFGDK